VNKSKALIDETKMRLDEKKKEREMLHSGTEEAEIIDEEEYSSFQALKEHKAKYKRCHEGLQELAGPFKAASDSVDALRQGLLDSFESWYGASFGEYPASAGPAPASGGGGDVMDDDEAFEQLQMQKVASG